MASGQESEVKNFEDDHSEFNGIPVDEGGTQLQKNTSKGLHRELESAEAEEKQLTCSKTVHENHSQIAETESLQVEELRNKTKKRIKILQEKEIQTCDLREIHKEFSTNLMETENKLYHLQTENNELVNEIKLRETEVQRLRNENSVAELKLKDKETEIVHLNDVKNLLDLEMQSQKEETLVISGRNKELGEEIQKNKTGMNRVDQEKRLLKSKLENLETECRSLRDRNVEIAELLRVKTGSTTQNCTENSLQLYGKTYDYGTTEGKLDYGDTLFSVTIQNEGLDIRILAEENSRVRQMHEIKERQRLTDESRILEREIHKHRTQLETIQKAREHVREKFETKDKDITKKRYVNATHEKHMMEKQEEMQNIAKEEVQLMKAHDEKRTEANKHSDEIKCLQQALQEDNTETERLELEIARMKKELQGKESAIESLKHEHTRLANLLKVKESETERLTEANVCFRNKLHDKEYEIEEVTEQNVHLSDELQLKEYKFTEVTEQNTLLGTKLREKQSKIEEVTEQNVHLSDELQHKEYKFTEVTEQNTLLGTKLREKQSKIEEVMEQKIHLSKELQYKEKEFSHITEENASLGKKLREKEAVMEDVCKQNVQISEALQHKERDFTDGAEENASLGIKLRKKEYEREQVAEQNMYLSKELQHKEHEVTEVTEENARLRNQKQEKESELQGMVEESVHLKKQIKEKESEIERVREGNTELRKSLTEINAEIEHMAEEGTRFLKDIEDKESDVTRFTEENTCHTKSLQEKRQQIAKLAEENARFAQILQEKVSHTEILGEENTRLQTVLRVNVQKEESLMAENIRLNKQLQEKELRINVGTEENVRLHDSLKDKDSTMKSRAEDNLRLSKELDLKERGITQITEENEVLREELLKKGLEEEYLIQDQQRLKKELQKHTLTTGNLTQDNSQLRENLHDSESVIQHLTEENERLRKQFKERNSRLVRELHTKAQETHLSDEKMKIEQRVLGTVAEAERLTEENQKTGEKLQQLEQELDQLTELNKLLTKLLDDRKAQSLKLRTENEELEETLQCTRNDREEREKELQNWRLEVHIVKHGNIRIGSALEQKPKELELLTNEYERLQIQLQENEAKTERLKEEIIQNEKQVNKNITEMEYLVNDCGSIGNQLQNVKTEIVTQRKVHGKLEDRFQEEQIISENDGREPVLKLLCVDKQTDNVKFKNTDLENKLEIKEERIKSLTGSREESEEKMQIKEMETQILTESIRKLKADVDVQEAFILQLRNEKSELGKVLRAEYSDRDRLSEGHAQLTDILSNKGDHGTQTMKANNSVAASNMYTDMNGVQNGTTENAVLGEEKQSRQTYTNCDSSNLGNGLQFKDTHTEFRNDESKDFINQACVNDTGAQDHKQTMSVTEMRPPIASELKRYRSLDAISQNPKSEDSKLINLLSRSKTDLTGVSEDKRRHGVLMNMPLVTSRYMMRSPAVNPLYTDEAHVKKTRMANINVNTFKVNMAALLFIRAINTKEMFEMASFMHTDTIDMFNDIILKLGGYTILLQLKGSPRSNTNINMTQILQLKGDFSLLRYCKSFCELKKEWMQNKYLQTYGRFEDCIFVVYTDAEMSHENGNNVGNTVWQQVICSGGKCFSFSKDKFPEVYEMFENFETYKQMLADVTYDSKPTTQYKLLGFIKRVWNSKVTTLPGLIELNKLLKELQELGDLSQYKEFLSRLWFVTGQANDHKMEEQIKREIGLACGMSETNLVYAHFKQQIQDWCKHSDTMLNHKSPFWKDIKMFHSVKGRNVT